MLSKGGYLLLTEDTYTTIMDALDDAAQSTNDREKLRSINLAITSISAIYGEQAYQLIADSKSTT